MEFFDDFPNPQFVARLGGADEIVVGDLQLFPDLLKNGNDAIGQRLRLNFLILSRFHHLDAVLVGAGEEKRVVAGQAVIAGECVGAESGVHVAEMGFGVWVIDRGGDVKLFCHLGP